MKPEIATLYKLALGTYQFNPAVVRELMYHMLDPSIKVVNK